MSDTDTPDNVRSIAARGPQPCANCELFHPVPQSCEDAAAEERNALTQMEREESTALMVPTKDVEPEPTFVLAATRSQSFFGGELRVVSPASASVNSRGPNMEPPALVELIIVRENGDMARLQANRAMLRTLAKHLGEAVKDGDVSFGSENW